MVAAIQHRSWALCPPANTQQSIPAFLGTLEVVVALGVGMCGHSHPCWWLVTHDVDCQGFREVVPDEGKRGEVGVPSWYLKTRLTMVCTLYL